MARVLAVALAALALAGSALAAGNPPKLHGSLAPPSPRLKAAAVKRIFLQQRQGRRLAAALPARPAGRRRLRQGDEALDDQGLGRPRRRGRDRARSTTRAARSPRPGPGRRWRGRWRAATPAPSAGGEINSAAGLARLLPALPARARRPAPAAQPAQPRPARAALVHRLALVLQPRRHLHERAAGLPAAALPARPHGLEHVARAARHRRRARSGRSGCSRPRPSSRRASGSGSTCAPRT